MRHPAAVAGIVLGCMGITLGLAGLLPAFAQSATASDPFRFAMQLYRDAMYLPAAEEFLRISGLSADRERASEARLWAARSYYGAGDWQRTIDVVEPLTINPVGRSRACGAFLLMGKARERIQEPARALDAYATLVGRYPDCPQYQEAAVRSGLITLNLGQARRGLGFLAKVSDDAPDSLRVIALLGQAKALTRLGEEEQATAVLRKLDESQLGGDACETRLEAGRIHAELRQLEDAATAYGIAAVNCADSLLRYEAWVSLASVRAKEEDWDSSGKAHEEAADLVAGDRSTEQLFLAGRVYAKGKHWDNAIRVLVVAEARERLSTELLMVLATAYRGTGDFSRAVQTYQIVEATSAGSGLASEARWRIAETYLDAGWYRLAANAFERFWLQSPRHPRSPEVLYMVGQTLADRLDRKAGAAEVLERVAGDYPYSSEAPEALLKAGECWLDVDFADRARVALQQIVKEYPTSPAAEPAQASIDFIDTYLLPDWQTARLRLQGALEGEGPRTLLAADVAFEDLRDYRAAASHYESVRESGADADPEGRALYRRGMSLWRIAADPRSDQSDPEGVQLVERASADLSRVVAEYPDSPWAREAQWILDRMEITVWEGEEEGRVLLELRLLDDFAEKFGASDPSARWELARTNERLANLGEADRFATAAEIFRIVAGNDPDLEEKALLGEARCWFGAGIHAEAAARYERLVGRYRNRPLEPEMIYRQAESLQRAEQRGPAAHLLKRLVRDFGDSPWSVRAAMDMGDLYEGSGDYEAAVESFEVALARTTQPALRQRAQLGLAESLGRLGRGAEAVSHLDELISHTRGLPTADRAVLLKGKIQQESGDFPGAEQTYRALLASAPSRDLEAEVWARLGDVLLAIGQDESAAGAYRHARSGALPEELRVGVLRNQAIAFYQSDQGLEGDSVLVALRGEEPPAATLASVVLTRGRHLVRTGNDEEGLRMFAMVMENFPADDLGLAARYEIALRHLGAREYAEARDLLVSIVQANPGPEILAGAWFRLGSTHYLMNQYAQAEESYQRVVGIEGGKGLAREAFFNLGLSQEKQDKWDEAARTYQQLLRQFPEFEGRDRVAFKIGYALQEAGQYSEAIAAYEAVLPVASPEVGAETQFWIAECYVRNKQLDRAILAFLKVGYLFPGQIMWAATADLRAAELYTRTGKPDQARAVYQRVVERCEMESQWTVMAREELQALGPAQDQGE